jgi:hypothetical protein
VDNCLTTSNSSVGERTYRHLSVIFRFIGKMGFS